MDLKEFAALEFEELKRIKDLAVGDSGEAKEQLKYVSKQMSIKWKFFVDAGIDTQEVVKFLPAWIIVPNWDAFVVDSESPERLLDLVLEDDPDWVSLSDKKIWIEERNIDVNKLYPYWKENLIRNYDTSSVYRNLVYLHEHGLTELKLTDIKKNGRNELFKDICLEPGKWEVLGINAKDFYQELIKTRYFDIMMDGPVTAMRNIMDFDTLLENIDMKHYLRIQIEKDGKDKIYFKKFIEDYIEEKGNIEGLAKMVVEQFDGYRNPRDNVVLYELFARGGARVMDAKQLAHLCSYKEHGEPAEKQAYRNLTNQIPIKKIRDTFSIYVSQKKLKEYFPKI